MIKRWLFYLAVLLGSIIFWVAHQGWVARLLMTVMFWLPWFSLAISLVPMLRSQPVLICPQHLKIGDMEPLNLILTGRIALPYRYKFEVRHSLQDDTCAVASGTTLPSSHCGELLVTCQKIDVFDLLGLFRIRRKLPPKSVLVYPERLPMDVTRELEKALAHSWKPKPGGGFAENHEMRLFRPGDGLNQIHWKLTAKTGKLTIRQPMIPNHDKILVHVTLGGAPDQLDRKMGRILWLGEHFLELGLNFELQAQHAAGTASFFVSCDADFEAAFRQLLRCSPVEEQGSRDTQMAPWYFHIGGEPDEA